MRIGTSGGDGKVVLAGGGAVDVILLIYKF